MSTADETLDREGAAPRARAPLGWRRVVRWFGIACLVTASGIGGYLGWLLWGTGLETKHQQSALAQQFGREMRTIPPGQEPSGPAPLPGSVYGELRIPRIRLDMYVVQGTAYEDLKNGPGHYLDTADPWDAHGRVGIAGHRTTYLAPFWNLQQMRPGDPILLVTTRGTFRYVVDRVFVMPESTAGVVLNQTKYPTLVLTTCNPRFSSSQRLIVTADRVG
ncbi:MAG: class E sortase [Actinobacteria bacterium]|nr:class E sortase [Actinomycetota bacterium]